MSSRSTFQIKQTFYGYGVGFLRSPRATTSSWYLRFFFDRLTTPTLLVSSIIPRSKKHGVVHFDNYSIGRDIKARFDRNLQPRDIFFKMISVHDSGPDQCLPDCTFYIISLRIESVNGIGQWLREQVCAALSFWWHIFRFILCFSLQCLEAQLVDFLSLVSATILFTHNLRPAQAKIQSIMKKLPIFPNFLHNGGTSKANLVFCTRWTLSACNLLLINSWKWHMTRNLIQRSTEARFWRGWMCWMLAAAEAYYPRFVSLLFSPTHECKSAVLNKSLARMGANTLGVDASESNIAIASVHSSADPKLSSESSTSSGSLTYLHSSAETLLSLPKRYDVVCSLEVLEHVDNPAAFLSTCAELLKVLETLSFLVETVFKFLRENSPEAIYFYQQSHGRR